MLQIKVALPTATAENLSVRTGALNAIADANKPTRLKRIKSMKILGSGKSNLRIRWTHSPEEVLSVEEPPWQL